MDKQDWYNMGAQIGDLVQSAIDSKDFKELNTTLTNALNATVDSVQKSMQEGIRRAQNTAGQEYKAGSWRAAYERAAQAGERYTEQWRRAAERATTGSQSVRYTQNENKVEKKASSKALISYKGTTKMALGYTFAGIFGMGTLVLGILARAFLPVILPAAVCLGLTVGSLLVGLSGRKFNVRLKRQKQYLQIMGERDTCTLEELAAGTGNSKKFVTKDLREMIQDHMFPQGAYLDAQETCLMTSQTAYRQYQDVLKQYEQRKAQEEKEAAEKAARDQDGSKLSKEIQDILREGRNFIVHIQECNEAIPDEIISDKLERLELVVTRIFDQVAKKPESAPDLRKLMSYYLPITRKLVDAYQDLDAQPLAGQNIMNTKKEIGDSLDTINTAFENLLDSFFEDTAWDISTDINVLHTMMAQDGLVGQEFKKR